MDQSSRIIRYSVFHRFRQTDGAYGGSILSSSHFSLLPQPPQETMLDIKVVKFDLKIIISLATLI
jgi:hypothetical protein